MSEVPKRAQEIWAEFLAPDSTCLVNVDSHSYEQTRKNIQDSQADRWSFDTALVQLLTFQIRLHNLSKPYM